MRKVYFMLMATLISVASFAQVNKSTIAYLSSRVPSYLKGHSSGQKNVENLKVNFSKTLNVYRVKAVEAAQDTAVIRTQPKGTLYSKLYRVAAGYYPKQADVRASKLDGLTAKYVIGEDNAFYLADPFSAFKGAGWLKGYKVSGDTIKFTLPQPVFSLPHLDESNEPTGTNDYYYAWKMHIEKTVDENGDSVLTYMPDSNQVLNYVLRNDTLTKVDTAFVGMGSNEGGWTGFGDIVNVEFVNKDVQISAPAGDDRLEVFSLKYVDVYNNNAGLKFVKGYVDDKNLYIKGFYDGAPEAWAKGEIRNNKAIFKKQYLGVDTTSAYHAYFVPVYVDSVYNQFYGSYTPVVEHETDSVIFDYDAATKGFTSDSAFVYNFGKHVDATSYLGSYYQPQITPYVELPATPKKPEFTFFFNYYPAYKYGSIAFNLYATGTKGETMNTSKMYYNVYFDDKIKEFAPSEYTALKKKMKDIPYTFNDGLDFIVNNEDHLLYYHQSGLHKIGVQLFYTGGGETNKSEIAWFDIDAYLGIKNVSSDETLQKGEVVSYHDLSGREVKNPMKGVYLKTMRLANGTTQTAKVVLK